MLIIKIVGFAIMVVILVTVIKQYRPEFAFLVSLVSGLIILGLILGKVGDLVYLLQEIASRTHIRAAYLNIIFKIIGIAYLAEFGVQICRDAGENALGTKVEFAGKILITVMAVPLLLAIVETLFSLLDSVV